MSAFLCSQFLLSISASALDNLSTSQLHTLLEKLETEFAQHTLCDETNLQRGEHEGIRLYGT